MYYRYAINLNALLNFNNSLINNFAIYLWNKKTQSFIILK